MPNATESQIKNRIAEFVQELDLMVRKAALQSLQDVLANGGGRPARRSPGRPARIVTGAGGRGRRPADLGDATTKIVSFVKANDGEGIGAIAAGTGLALPVAKQAAGRPPAEGRLKQSREQGGTGHSRGP